MCLSATAEVKPARRSKQPILVRFAEAQGFIDGLLHLWDPPSHNLPIAFELMVEGARPWSFSRSDKKRELSWFPGTSPLSP